MANRNKLDRKGRPFKKMSSGEYEGYKYWDNYRAWYPVFKYRGQMYKLRKKRIKKLCSKLAMG